MLDTVRSFLPKAKDYDLRFLRNDLLAGLTVAVVALPLALGFGVTSGAGAAAGLYTAIVAGIVAALFGGSSLQVSGPTGAMTAVLLPIVAQYGVAALPALGVMAGALLLVMAFARIGRYVHYIPWPVISGFTNGIAVIIFLQQLPGFLGVDAGEGPNILVVSYDTFAHWLTAPQYQSIALGALTLAVMVGWRRFERLNVVPASMAALVTVTALSLLPAFDAVQRIGIIPRTLPTPTLPLLDLSALGNLFEAALAVAVLSALESLISAVVADGMTVDQKHDPDRELFGQGLANIAAGVFGGIPATAALARTAVNVRSGAKTRLAAVIHSAALLAVVLFLAPLAGRIPLAVLAGILMVVAYRMVDRQAGRHIWRATKSDAFVFALTTGVTVLFDLILAIEVGLVAAGVLFIIRMSNMFSVDVEELGDQRVPKAETPSEARAEEQLLGDHIVAYRIDGPVFFGAANRFIEQLVTNQEYVGRGEPIKAVILRMGRVPVMDATGATALHSTVERLEKMRILVLISGLQPQPEQVLSRMGVLASLSRNHKHLFKTTDEAIEHAYAHLRLEDHTGPTRR